MHKAWVPSPAPQTNGKRGAIFFLKGYISIFIAKKGLFNKLF
jgi:hypothetical protein